MVIADSSVWIAFQRDPGSAIGRAMDSLLADREVTMVGPVLSELLRGARSGEELGFIAERLSFLPFLDTDQSTWLQAGDLSFRLKVRGLTMAFADLVIATLAMQHAMPLYTIYQDFQRIQGLHLYAPEATDGRT